MQIYRASARLTWLIAASACAITLVASAADKNVQEPPIVEELDPMTVEGKRSPEDVPKKVDPEQRLKEELAKDKKAMQEYRDARGNGRVRVQSPLFTYCLDYNQNPLLQNSVGNTLIIPTYCGPGVK